MPSIKKIFNKKEVIHAFGILGIVGPLFMPNSGWMVTNFVAWVSPISHMKGYMSERSAWRTIQPISHLFPDGSVTFGEVESDQLQLPLPSTLETVFDSEHAISAKPFVSKCLLLLYRMAQKMKPSEKLVLLLIGRGKFEARKFQFLITMQTNKVTGEDFIIKDELEYALKPCQGDILIIRNSSYPGPHHLVSERWMLFCPE